MTVRVPIMTSEVWVLRPRHRDAPTTSGYSTREHCEIVRESHEEERVVGYRVRCEYNDRTYETRTETEPGDTISLRVSVSPVI